MSGKMNEDLEDQKEEQLTIPQKANEDSVTAEHTDSIKGDYTEESKPKGQSAVRGGIDMTVGSPARQIIRFCLPLLLGNVLQQLYNTVDSMVVGRFVGSNALAAVGASGPVLMLMIGFFMGISAGASILVSQSFGAHNFVQLRKIIHTVISLTVMVSIVISVAGVALTPWILRLLNTPAEVMELAVTYMTVTFIGILSLTLYNLLNSIFHGIGDAKSPFIILAVCSVLNIILDLVFVLVFDWGVAGVAWATVFAQCCSVVFGFIKIYRTEKVLRISLRELNPSADAIRQVIKIGIPTGAQNALSSIGNIFVSSLLNSFGAIIMAANVAVIKVDSFCTMPAMAFGTAITVFVGQNMGAGKPERIKKGLRSTLCMSVAISLFISILLLLFGNYPLMLFTKDTAVVQAGMDKFYRVAPFYFCLAVFNVYAGAVRGQGRAVAPMIIGVVTMFVGRVPVAYFFSQMIGANGIHWSLSVQWLLEAVVIVIFYYMGRRKSGQIGRRRKEEVPRKSEQRAEPALSTAKKIAKQLIDAACKKLVRQLDPLKYRNRNGNSITGQNVKYRTGGKA